MDVGNGEPTGQMLLTQQGKAALDQSPETDLLNGRDVECGPLPDKSPLYEDAVVSWAILFTH